MRNLSCEKLFDEGRHSKITSVKSIVMSNVELSETEFFHLRDIKLTTDIPIIVELDKQKVHTKKMMNHL